MAVFKDIMPAFDLLQPDSAADAVTLLDKYRDEAWVMAGGMDSLDWLKDRLRKPRVLVDLSGIDELKGIRSTSDGGVEIGAMTTLTEIGEHPLIKKNYSLLAEAVEHVAAPQIRNQGTLGGNVSQDVRCWYYRGGWPCYREGGNTCYADTPVGRNREHAIFGADRCVAVHPSDSSPALIALDAKFVIRSSKSERTIDAEDYFIGPNVDITKINILKPGDLLTSIRIPAKWAGSKFYFEKIRDRNVWDFPLMNVASAMKLSGNTIQGIRIAVNAAAPTPLRLKAVEAAVTGKPANAETGKMAGELAVKGAVPLQFNAYKIPLMRNLVKRAIGGVSPQQAENSVAGIPTTQEASWT